ncbi:MAG: hypothetical protein QOI47_1392 [Actinomycetota bacterium]|jgi:SAM-dependent methyltransferase|nr:hypothetical protein [Actinomycetota bacterium]
MFDKLYRAEPAFDGAPPPVVPWDIARAQPRLMELEALGAITGDVLDIGCGQGDNAIFLASRGHSVTALDASPAAIEQARGRAAKAGVTVTFGVANAVNLTGYDGQFDTVVDSALYHCLVDDDRLAYAASMHRATRPGARWYLYCFSAGRINGIIASMGAVQDSNLRDTFAATGWKISFLGPTTFLGNGDPLRGGVDEIPAPIREQMAPEQLDQMRDVAGRYATIAPLLEDDRLLHMPFTVVHADRVD